jgi:hypothetical protein
MTTPRESPRPLPVLFLVTHLETGGAERQLAELVTRMDRARFRPIVVCQKGGGPFFDQIAAAGIEAHQLRTPHRGDPRFALRLASICKTRHVRAMVIRGFSTMVVGLLVGKMLGIRPIIMAEHATGRIDRDPKKKPIERRLAPRVDGVIAVAKGQIPFLVEDKGFDPAKIRVVYNGIDLAQWSPTPRDTALLAELGIPENANVHPRGSSKTTRRVPPGARSSCARSRGAFPPGGRAPRASEAGVASDKLGLGPRDLRGPAHGRVVSPCSASPCSRA